MDTRHERDLGFFVWAAPGFLLVVGPYSGFTIGIPFIATGLVLFGYLWGRGPEWPADLGFPAGLGLGSLSFAAIAIGSGDYASSPWLEIGLGLVGLSAGTFWWLRCRPSRA